MVAREELRLRVAARVGWSEERELQRACLRFDDMTTGLWTMTNTAQR
jgi:hypothetical protein